MSRQRLAVRKQVVSNHAGANSRTSALALFVNGNCNREGSYDMRSDSQQRFAFTERLANEAKLKMFEIAQTSMDKTSRSAARPASDVALIQEQDFKPAHRSIAGDPRAVDAGADNDD